MAETFAQHGIQGGQRSNQAFSRSITPLKRPAHLVYLNGMGLDHWAYRLAIDRQGLPEGGDRLWVAFQIIEGKASSHPGDCRVLIKGNGAIAGSKRISGFACIEQVEQKRLWR